METVKGDNKVMLLEAFTKDTGIRLGIETRREYTWWLEQQVVKNLAIPVVMPSAFEKLTDKELEEAEHSKLNEIAELHKQWKAILNEQFYRKHPECKPH